ncbi:hypothetical protein GRJ2_002134600 [Grus japonensis]|uniref:Uncharacterized protein n=1 Tax=Grus japonensis TaxID=30415 RepID=A0ABC9XGA0_GRUJA
MAGGAEGERNLPLETRGSESSESRCGRLGSVVMDFILEISSSKMSWKTTEHNRKICQQENKTVWTNQRSVKLKMAELEGLLNTGLGPKEGELKKNVSVDADVKREVLAAGVARKFLVGL